MINTKINNKIFSFSLFALFIIIVMVTMSNFNFGTLIKTDVSLCGINWQEEHDAMLASLLNSFLGFYLWLCMIVAGLGLCAWINIKIIARKRIKSSDREKNNLKLLMKAGVIGFFNFGFVMLLGGDSGIDNCMSPSKIYLLLGVGALAVIFFLFSLVMRLASNNDQKSIRTSNIWLVYGGVILTILLLDIIILWPIYVC